MNGAKLTFKEIQDKKKPRTGSVRIVLDDTVGKEYEKAKAAVDVAERVIKSDGPSKDNKAVLSAAQKALEAASAAVEDNSILFTFKSINRNKIDSLIEENPASPKQKRAAEEAQEEIQWNPETFPPALIAVSLVEPELTEEEVQEMWESDQWTTTELLTLFSKALEVNQGSSVVNLKKD